jgi:sucrose-6-phosphate hydrolase SacC (GH32 family)
MFQRLKRQTKKNMMRPMLPTLIFTAVTTALAGHAAEPAPLQDKTLVAWVAPANLTQRGGSVLTVFDGRSGGFDGVVFGEVAPQKWMAGSENYRRTEKQQAAWPVETAGTNTLVQIAIVYRGNEVTVFRNGKEYSRHTIKEPQAFGTESTILIGPRHLGNDDCFAGVVDDARIYNRALLHQELAALQPNIEGLSKPWAWWTFDDAAAKDHTGRYPHTRLTAGAKIENGRLVLDGQSGSFFAASRAELLPVIAAAPMPSAPAVTPEAMVLNYHLMHPGGDSSPGDPNAAFYLDGTYHLHYILQHPWNGKRSFAFVHVTSPDMLHWTWQPTKLQPSFTGHGMFSGTGFITKDGKPAAIYHGAGSGRNQIAIAKDNQLSDWEKPYPVEVRNADGTEAKMRHWDPDCFLIGDTYYGYSGGQNSPLFKSKDLKNWTYVGKFLQHDMPDVAIGEDISCGNFFKIGDPSDKLGTGKWMLLCISHPLGCRYYLGDWDAKAEQFVPEKHGRMNWRFEDQPLEPPYRGFFAPESVLTPDGRRVMWAWLTMPDGGIVSRTIQSLPRELSLPADGLLRIKPLRELESLRYDPVTHENITVNPPANQLAGGFGRQRITALNAEALEIRVTIAREQAERKRFGFTLFSDGKGGGLSIVIRPETGTLRLGTTEAPFVVAELPKGEDVELRIFIDKYLVEVFANDRQAMVAAHMDYRGKTGLDGYSFGAPTTIKKIEIWKLKPTNQGFREAQKNRSWEPQTK